MTHTETSFLRQGKADEVSSFFWAIPIKPSLVTINATEYWAKQPSFNICVWYQHGHRFYNREWSKQEIHNSIKTGYYTKALLSDGKKRQLLLRHSPEQRSNLRCQQTSPNYNSFHAPSRLLCTAIQLWHSPAAQGSFLLPLGGSGRRGRTPPSPAAEQGLPHGSCTAPRPQPWARCRGSTEWTASPAHRFVIKQQETKSRCCKE